MNEGKSSAWGTSSEARKTLKTCLPNVPIVLELDVLGTVLYTSERSHFCFSEARLKKIVHDTENIAALPVGRSVRSFLIGAKIIPQMSFGSHITKIPIQVLKTVENAVAKALWVGQPMWRSKQLLQVILSKPHRTDPKIAGAYLTVLEVVRLCYCNPEAIQQIQRTWAHACGNHCLVGKLQTALQVLNIDFDDSLNISFLNSSPVSLFDLSPKCIAKPLQNIARHACYCSIDPRSRKDFHKPSGIFDFQQTTRCLFGKSPRFSFDREHCLRLENVLVGCVLTNDRLAASGWVTSATCRFCDRDKECLEHLLRCPKVHEILGTPTIHDFGSNFATLGHFQHPAFVAKRRLQCSDLESIDLASSFTLGHHERLWTDGSVLFAENFWITHATYAVLDEAQRVRHKGLVQHWNISSYAAELWAILIACAAASFPTTIYCDCLSVVEQAQLLFSGQPPKSSWSHGKWWNFLHRIVQNRQTICTTPFRIMWIPAHCFEGIPTEFLTHDLAALKGTTVEHILHNRLVDAAAKEFAHRTATVFPSVQQKVQSAIAHHQRWLVDLHCLLPTDQPDRAKADTKTKPEQKLTIATCRARFPTWLWGTPLSQYTWKPKIPQDLACPSKWTGHTQDWTTCLAFIGSLRWYVDEGESFSFNELSVLFHCGGFALQKDRDLVTFLDIYKAIREAMQNLSKDDSADPHPGSFHTTRPRSCGRTLPQGCIVGAIPHMSDDVRVRIASLFSRGAGRTLQSWNIACTAC